MLIIKPYKPVDAAALTELQYGGAHSTEARNEAPAERPLYTAHRSTNMPWLFGKYVEAGPFARQSARKDCSSRPLKFGSLKQDRRRTATKLMGPEPNMQIAIGATKHCQYLGCFFGFVVSQVPHLGRHLSAMNWTNA